MFQSIWNVAAAFCTHEKSNTTLTMQHFGHHISSDTDHIESKSASFSEHSNISKQNQFDDHTDHLPSFAQFMLLDSNSSVTEHASAFSKVKPSFDWHNFYQSPYLAFLSPPPNLAPL